MSKKQRIHRQRPETLAALLLPAYEENLEANLGNRLRDLRRQQGLSLRALAEKSGLSANTLSLIENGKTSPSVSTLQQISLALSIPITSFFEPDADREPVVYTQNDRRMPVGFHHGFLEDVGLEHGADSIQPFIVMVNPHAESSTQPSTYEGLEFIYCISGKIIYTVIGKEYPLSAGDTLLFSAKMPHAWKNPLDEPCRLVIVMAAAEEKRRPIQVHYPL